MLRAILYAYVLGGVTFVPLVLLVAVFITVYTSVPVGDAQVTNQTKVLAEADSRWDDKESEKDAVAELESSAAEAANDLPRTRKGWLTVRRTFHETASDGSYVTLVRSFLDSRSKDPKRSRPKDMWYVVLKGTVLYLYEDEEMSECEAVIELSQHQALIYPEMLSDAELFAKRNAICLRPKLSARDRMPSLSRKMRMQPENVQEAPSTDSESLKEHLAENEAQKNAAGVQAMDPTTPWFIFVRSNVDMEDWYFSLIHASEHPAQTPTLSPLQDIFDLLDMNHLVSTLDEQPDVIPMRWLNALLGRIFFSHYRTQALESYIIGRLMKKLSKVKMPAFLTEVAVTNVSVGKRAPMFSKPMLKELAKEGDAAIEVHLHYRGEVRITLEATAVINLGARFKSYTVKLVLAAVIKELEGNLLIKVKRPPSNRMWYAFTQTPRIVMKVEPIVSDRQITWGMILSTIESKFKEIIQESVVLPNMDDIAFFDSEPYQRRGGIWSDAGRKSLVPSSATFTSQEENPLVSVDTTMYESTQKADNASIQSAPAALSAPSEVASSSTNLGDSADSSRNSTRRRTWFTSDEETDATLTPASIAGSYSDKPEDRNHTQEPDIPSPPLTAVSSNEPKASPTDDSMERTSDPKLLSTTIRSIPSRRSTSQHSIEVPQNLADQEPAPVPRKNSDASARSPSPPSFFNTLKARTADKQAIKETAKEAIRKWGVNWGSFRKDNNAVGPGQGDDNSEASTLPQGEGDGKTSTHKSRASYAEVRAAVAERKGREKASHLLVHGPNHSSDISPSETTNFLTRGTTLTPDAISTSSEIAALARLPSPSGVAVKSSSPSRMNTEQDVPHQDRILEDPINPTPIHVQPVAKTMSIPGIHASHRGEVQSMGYVAPQPSGSSGPMSETVLKNPAIQSVYRFLKSNGDRKQDSSELMAHDASHSFGNSSRPSSLLSPTEFHDETAHSGEVPVSTAVSSPQSALKPTPPPLPPRSIPVVRHETSMSPSRSVSLDSTREKDGHIQTDNPKSVVESTSQGLLEDETFSSSIKHQTDLEEAGTTSTVSLVGNGTPPPLPPRKTPILDATDGQ